MENGFVRESFDLFGVPYIDIQMDRIMFAPNSFPKAF
jgi:hypothetical protein